MSSLPYSEHRTIQNSTQLRTTQNNSEQFKTTENNSVHPRRTLKKPTHFNTTLPNTAHCVICLVNIEAGPLCWRSSFHFRNPQFVLESSNKS